MSNPRYGRSYPGKIPDSRDSWMVYNTLYLFALQLATQGKPHKNCEN